MITDALQIKSEIVLLRCISYVIRSTTAILDTITTSSSVKKFTAGYKFSSFIRRKTL